MSDLDAIKARLAAVHAAGASGITVRLADHGIRVIVQMRDWDGNIAHEANAAVTTLLGHAPADIGALVAEVERLRGEVERERAAVVAWLRAEAARLRKAEFVGSRAYVLESTAYMIENGVHADQKEKA